MKLYEIPNNSKMMVRVKGETEKRPATFHHIDGLYSFCTLDNGMSAVDGGISPIFHLYFGEEMVAVGDPATHYELAGDRT